MEIATQKEERFWGIDSGPVMLARLDASVARCNEDEPQRRLWFTDQGIKRAKKRIAKFYPAGSLITVAKVPGWEPYEGDARGKRGKCRGFNRASQGRFQATVATIDRKAALPRMITLTYPLEYPEEFADWKQDLEYFADAFKDKYPDAGFLWKLEPQERGAPHYHLLVWGVPFIDRDWLSDLWFRVVGSGDEKHLRAGTRVEFIRTFNGVMSYAGKNYMGKECKAPRNWPENVGRYWGVYGRKNIPRSECVEMEMSYQGLIRIHRLIRGYMKSKGVDWRTGGGVRLFTSKFALWLRAFEWAEDWFTHPIDNDISASLQPY